MEPDWVDVFPYWTWEYSSQRILKFTGGYFQQKAFDWVLIPNSETQGRKIEWLNLFKGSYRLSDLLSLGICHNFEWENCEVSRSFIDV